MLTAVSILYVLSLITLKRITRSFDSPQEGMLGWGQKLAGLCWLCTVEGWPGGSHPCESASLPGERDHIWLCRDINLIHIIYSVGTWEIMNKWKIKMSCGPKRGGPRFYRMWMGSRGSVCLMMSEDECQEALKGRAREGKVSVLKESGKNREWLAVRGTELAVSATSTVA